VQYGQVFCKAVQYACDRNMVADLEFVVETLSGHLKVGTQIIKNVLNAAHFLICQVRELAISSTLR